MLLLPLLLIVAVAVLSSNFGVMRGGGEPFRRQAVVWQRLVVCQSSCDVLKNVFLWICTTFWFRPVANLETATAGVGWSAGRLEKNLIKILI